MCPIHNHHNRKKWFLKGFLFAIVFLVILSLALMILWNLLMPSIFGLGGINYLQALGLLILSKILFSGFGRRHGFDARRYAYWKKRQQEWEEQNPQKDKQE
jgi:hypothetical protein